MRVHRYCSWKYPPDRDVGRVHRHRRICPSRRQSPFIGACRQYFVLVLDEVIYLYLIWKGVSERKLTWYLRPSCLPFLNACDRE